MAQISASLVKELRGKTGAAMGDCKKALIETDGDVAKAVGAGAETVMIGNLLGERLQDVPIGASVEPVFEDHPDADPAYTLIQYRLA